MMRQGAWMPVMLLLVVAVAGCTSKGPEAVVDEIPEEVSQQEIERLEQAVLEQYPRSYSFAGQQAADPLRLAWEGTLKQGDAVTSIEYPHDHGIVDRGGTVILYPLDAVPADQAVELRIKLKWQGDVGSSADLDIYVDVPGTRDAFQANRYDESMNWNRITKTRIVNAVKVAGEPFDIGIQVSNGKVISGEVPYTLSVEVHQAKDVLAPGVPYALMVPQNASGFLVESEPVVGDEHVTSEFVVIGPDDQLVRYVQHNDIGTSDLFVPVSKAGEYVVYAHRMHGGFLRLASDIPNPESLARTLAKTTAEVVLHAGQPAPGTYREQCVPSVSWDQNLEACATGTTNQWGAEGSFEVSGQFPLDLAAFVRTEGGGTANAALNITGPNGWVSTSHKVLNREEGDDRYGFSGATWGDRSALALGPYTFGVVDNGGQAELGYTIVGYTR